MQSHPSAWLLTTSGSGSSESARWRGQLPILALVFALVLAAFFINLYLVPEQFIVGVLFVVPIVIGAQRLSARFVAIVSGLAIALYVLDAILEKPPVLMIPLTVVALVAIAYFAIGVAHQSEVARIAARRSEEVRQEAARAFSSLSGSEERYRALYEEAREAVRARDEFLSIAAHELRTPTNVVSVVAEALLHRTRSDVGARNISEDLTLLIETTERLRRLTHRVLDLSQITAGKLFLSREEFDLRDLISEIARRFEPGAARVNCSLELALESVRGRWDRERLDQVATNLLANAIKYGVGKPVRVKLAMSEGVALLRVLDHGIGIPLDEQHRIFERFERGGWTRGRPGIGLGLWIARRIVEEHGGSIEVDSEFGRGSEFRVRLPLG